MQNNLKRIQLRAALEIYVELVPAPIKSARTIRRASSYLVPVTALFAKIVQTLFINLNIFQTWHLIELSMELISHFFEIKIELFISIRALFFF